METQADLLEVIANGENSKVELKCDTIENHELAKELVAFSNLQGGVVLLGVNNDQTIAGLTRDALEEWVMNLCRDKIRPAIIPTFYMFKDVEPGKDVAVIEVSRSIYVHSLYHKNKNTYYIRVGSQNREPTSEELSRLFQQRGMLRVDIRPIPRAKASDLDRQRLIDYFRRIRQQEIPDNEDDDEWQTLLFNTGFIDEGVTLSAILLFGKNPNRFLPQAGIDAASFPGVEKDYAMKEQAALRGPLTPLIGRDGALLEAGLVEQALYFINRNTSVTASLKDGARLTERRTYPDEAVREAIVNALIHRDYLLAGTNIELAIYQDRLEIISPGKLINGITPDRMRAGVRSTRNEVLKNVMRDYRYMEHMGMGVSRKIVLGMREHNGTEPDLVEKDERFIVRLFAERE